MHTFSDPDNTEPLFALEHFFKSFKGRLMLAFGGLTFAALSGLGGYLGGVATKEMTQTRGELLHTSAKAAAEILATNIRERGLEIDLLRRAPFLAQGDLRGEAVRQALELRKSAHDEYVWLGVAGLDGKILQATEGKLLGVDVSQRPWFKVGQSGPFTSDVHDALPLAQQHSLGAPPEPLPRLVDFSAPVVDEKGTLLGVLGAHVSWDWITSIVDHTVKGPLGQRQVEVLIANGNDEVLFPAAYVGQLKLPPEGKFKRHYETLAWSDGVDYLTSIVDVREVTQSPLNWQIVLRQPMDEAYRPVRELGANLFLIGLVSVLVFAVAAYYLANKVIGPLEKLANAAEMVQSGTGVPQFPNAKEAYSTEIEQLCASFQSMTESLLGRERELKELNASLEAQVATRTTELSRTNQALSDANEELARLATSDALTGIPNRRRFDEKLQEAFQTMKRMDRRFTLLMLDADHFKRVNDQHGHQVGDEVLKQLAQVIAHNVRATDMVARYGGEEFAVLLPETTDDRQGLMVAEKIRAAVEASEFPRVGKMTVSVGVGCANPSDTSGKAVVRRADEALYEAKGAGRNRVQFQAG